MTIITHIHTLSSKTQHHWTFSLTTILQFSQTCSCWNDLVSPSRTALLWIKPHSWMWPQSNRSRTWVKGTAKTLSMMMGAHPPPPARASISLFWTFNGYNWFKRSCLCHYIKWDSSIMDQLTCWKYAYWLIDWFFISLLYMVVCFTFKFTTIAMPF